MDNVRPHTAGLVDEFFGIGDIVCMEWPTHLLNLNPTEYVLGQGFQTDGPRYAFLWPATP